MIEKVGLGFIYIAAVTAKTAEKEPRLWMYLLGTMAVVWFFVWLYARKQSLRDRRDLAHARKALREADPPERVELSGFERQVGSRKQNVLYLPTKNYFH